MSHFVIETTGLTRRFDALTAVQELDLCVPSGSVYGFLGPNGAGKTTTIRLLLGLIRPNAGEVRLFGRSMCKDRLALLGRVGSLVEVPSLYPHLTGRENLELLCRLKVVDLGHIDRVLEIVRLEMDADRLVRHYSSGMRQRLGLGLALLGEPDLLILDEPTNGLDPAGIREMRTLITSLPSEHNVTVFLSSHLLNEVEQVATHIGIIRDGELIFQGTPDGLRSRLREIVNLGTDQPEAAQRLLTRDGWTVRRNGDRGLVIEVNGESDAAMLNAQLVRSGYNVTHLQVERPSLEDVFLTLTSA